MHGVLVKQDGPDGVGGWFADTASPLDGVGAWISSVHLQDVLWGSRLNEALSDLLVTSYGAVTVRSRSNVERSAGVRSALSRFALPCRKSPEHLGHSEIQARRTRCQDWICRILATPPTMGILRRRFLHA